MVTVDHTKCTRLHDILCVAADNIVKIIYTSRVATVNGHWAKWDTLCRDMALDLLLVSYRDPVPIINTFKRQ